MKGVKGSKNEDFIIYLSHRKTVLSLGMHKKSLGNGRGVYHSNSHISRFHRTCPVNPQDSRGPRLDSKRGTRLVQSAALVWSET
jgi:hypothetical protein